ncbi:MAG: phosphate/phosphite/phosphonate ABC transporter substrate-binding protein [Planctomycetes bacterium]|nr:phosphate/phosphite/phosphonate ABC transporter substrate-binding protein [Planctomycetota bacterium]
MSEPIPSSAPAQGAPAPVPPAARKSSWKYTLGLIAVLVAGAGGYYLYVRAQNPEPPPVDELTELKAYLTRLAANQKLADGYADTDPKDLVADTPKDPSKWAKVDGELVFTVVGTDDPAKAVEEWKDFMAALGKATGKKVKYLDGIQTIEDQLTAVREGRLHVTAFNTGAVPMAVNTAGFVPLFAPADAQGKFSYEMEILVRADSPVKTPADLKGKTVGFVALSSNSGAKAPMVTLKDEFGLLPGRDYKYAIIGEHIRSVKELVAGRCDAACVANDLLHRAEASGELDKTKYRSLYVSKPFPPLCFGVPHHLPPELRGKVARAFAEFQFAGTSVGKRYVPQGKTKFAAVSYEKDWEYVRKIDDTLSHLLDGR